MPDTSINAPLKAANAISQWVFYNEDVALLEGQAVCYEFDLGTATDRIARRYNQVKLPTVSNAQHFAGVAAKGYSLNVGGRFIEIYVPGSVCNILTKVAGTIAQALLTFDLTSGVIGRFLRSGLPGRGSAVLLQTVSTAGTEGLGLAYLQTGLESGGVELVAGVGGSAFVAMVGGTTLLTGYAAATDATETIVDGTIEGLRKKFAVSGTVISGGGAMVITIDNSDGIKLAGTALATLTYTNGATGAGSELVWENGHWVHVRGAGWVEA